MPDSSERTTQDKIHSLRIDPARKEARNRSRGGWLTGLIVGLLLGIGLTIVFKSVNIGPIEVRTVSARVVETGGGDPNAIGATIAAVPAGETVLTANGYVTPRHRISLSPRVMGQVAWVGIEKGDRVEKDQVLVRLKDDEYQAQVKQAEARLGSAEARLKELLAGSRDEEIQRARAELRAAEATLKNSEITLTRTEKLVRENQVDPKFTLDDARAARDQAKARYDAAQHALDLLVAGPRREQIDAARAEVEAAKAALEYSRIMLQDTVIRAPVDGTVLEKLIEAGELVTPQSFGGTRGARTELLSLANLSDLQVEVDVNESDFAKIQMGQPARVTLDAYPDRHYSGRVREIAPEANRQKATVQIKVQIFDPDALILPEMNARVDFIAGKETTAPGEKDQTPPSAISPTAPAQSMDSSASAQSDDSATSLQGVESAASSRHRVFIPKEAVTRRDDATVVFVAAEGRAILRPVTLSPSQVAGNEVEIASGLAGGEPVIVTTPSALRDGQRIRIVQRSE